MNPSINERQISPAKFQPNEHATFMAVFRTALLETLTYSLTMKKLTLKQQKEI